MSFSFSGGFPKLRGTFLGFYGAHAEARFHPPNLGGARDPGSAGHGRPRLKLRPQTTGVFGFRVFGFRV